MTFPDILKTCLLNGGHIDYALDAAEGLRFWSMNSETDELLIHSFTAEQCCAVDWVNIFIPPVEAV